MHVTERLLVRSTPFPGDSITSALEKAFERGAAVVDPRGVAGGPSDAFDRTRKSGVLGAETGSYEPLPRSAVVSALAPRILCFTLNS